MTIGHIMILILVSFFSTSDQRLKENFPPASQQVVKTQPDVWAEPKAFLCCQKQNKKHIKTIYLKPKCLKIVYLAIHVPCADKNTDCAIWKLPANQCYQYVVVNSIIEFNDDKIFSYFNDHQLAISM